MSAARPLKIGIVAGEESGDLLGADAIAALKAATGRDITLVGVGGRHLQALRRWKALDVAHLALAEDEDARRLQILVEPGERETGLLNVRAGDDAPCPAGATEQLDRHPEGLGPAGEEVGDGHRGRRHDGARGRSGQTGIRLPVRSDRDARPCDGRGR